MDTTRSSSLDIKRSSSLICLLCLVVTTSAVTKIQTVSIHSPTSGAVLNPIGAAINTKLQAKIYGSPYVYGQYSPYAGIGLGAGLAGYGAAIAPLAVGGYGTLLGGYGGVPGYQYGYPGAYTVKTLYPPGKAIYDDGHAGFSYGGVYPNFGGYSYGFTGLNRAYGAELPYGINQVGYNPSPGYLTYSAVNKLSGYGQ